MPQDDIPVQIEEPKNIGSFYHIDKYNGPITNGTENIAFFFYQQGEDYFAKKHIVSVQEPSAFPPFDQKATIAVRFYSGINLHYIKENSEIEYIKLPKPGIFVLEEYKEKFFRERLIEIFKLIEELFLSPRVEPFYGSPDLINTNVKGDFKITGYVEQILSNIRSNQNWYNSPPFGNNGISPFDNSNSPPLDNANPNNSYSSPLTWNNNGSPPFDNGNPNNSYSSPLTWNNNGSSPFDNGNPNNSHSSPPLPPAEVSMNESAFGSPGGDPSSVIGFIGNLKIDDWDPPNAYAAPVKPGPRISFVKCTPLSCNNSKKSNYYTPFITIGLLLGLVFLLRKLGYSKKIKKIRR